MARLSAPSCRLLPDANSRTVFDFAARFEAVVLVLLVEGIALRLRLQVQHGNEVHFLLEDLILSATQPFESQLLNINLPLGIRISVLNLELLTSQNLSDLCGAHRMRLIRSLLDDPVWIISGVCALIGRMKRRLVGPVSLRFSHFETNVIRLVALLSGPRSTLIQISRLHILLLLRWGQG